MSERVRGQDVLGIIAREALGDVPAYHQLPAQSQEVIARRLTVLLTTTERVAGGRWNHLSWFSSQRRLIRDDLSLEDESLAEVTSGTASLKAQVRELGIAGNSARAMSEGALVKSVFMLQAGVTTMHELNGIRRKVKKGVTGAEGRQFRTNEVGPPDTRQTSLHRIPWSESET